jgi:hypothetical protein
VRGAEEGPGERVGEVALLRARHGWRLAGDVLWTARATRAWWLLPIVALALIAVASAGAAHTAVPYAVYTFF